MAKKRARRQIAKRQVARRRSAPRSAPRDLSAGVIVVLSGGGFDAMNPEEVRQRMDQYISDVNADPFVQANTGGNGLTFKLLPNQRKPHLHQAKWRQICAALNLLAASPLILVGHSNGGAAAVDLARCLQSQGKSVDLLFTADSVLTLDDIGDINKIPANVKLNFNPYVIPTPAWLLAPFPIGTRNRRQVDNSLDGILNIGLTYNLPGALAHRNAFYELAGGDRIGSSYRLPRLLLDVTLAVLHGQTNFDIIHDAEVPLQQLATKSRLVIELQTATFTKTLRP
jgi:pimeloyl-ACP methyl ester carboxylesterase